MTAQKYDRLTTACFLIATASALFFESAGRFRWLLLCTAFLAGLTTVVTYFHNVWGDKLAERVPQEGMKAAAGGQPRQEAAASARWHFASSPAFGAREDILHLYRVRWTAQEVRRLRSSVHAYEKRDWDVVGKVVEIIRRLSTTETRGAFEFILTPEGQFTIRPMARSIPSEEKQIGVSAEEITLQLQSAKPN